MPLASSHNTLFVAAVIALVPLFALMGVGVLARRAKMLERADAHTLTRFALEIALPALIIVTLATRRFSAAYLLLPVSLWIAQAIAVGCVLLVSRVMHLKRHTTGSAILAMFGNTSFLGWPITTAIFPEMLPAAVVIDQFGMTMVLYALGPILGVLYGEGETKDVHVARELLLQARSPLFIALGIGIVLRGLTVLWPSMLAGPAAHLALYTLQIIGAASIPVVMVAIGMRLSAGAAGRCITPILCLGAIKLFLEPAICYGIGRFVFHLHGDLLSVSVLEAAMPSAATSVVFASRYRMNSDLAVAAFFVLTVASAITMPLMISVLR